MNNTENFILPDNAPVISAGVIITNIILNAAKSSCGIVGASAEGSATTPLNNI